MPKSKITDPIIPFPEEINRNHFASWLSGFVDGEGHFGIRAGYIKNNCQYGCLETFFKITLRDDDSEIIEKIQSYFQCGLVRRRPFQGKIKVINKNDQITFSVNAISDLHNILLPHFDNYPLQAKKAYDYIIWKQAVILLFSALGRKRQSTRDKGFLPKYTKEERNYFHYLHKLMIEQRKYKQNKIKPNIKPLRETCIKPAQLLFDFS